jgi:hypothetical protein
VVLGFYGNDYEDNVKSDLFRLADDKLVDANKVFDPGVRILDWVNAVPMLRWLSENSYLYSLTLNTIWFSAKRKLFTSSQVRAEEEFAMPMETIDEYKSKLQVRLLERMYAFCRARDILLILLDIPEVSENNAFNSSVPDDLVAAFQANSDVFVRSTTALRKYRGTAEFHVPHGDRHISEFTHLMLGISVAEAIRGSLSGLRDGDPPNGCMVAARRDSATGP